MCVRIHGKVFEGSENDSSGGRDYGCRRVVLHLFVTLILRRSFDSQHVNGDG